MYKNSMTWYTYQIMMSTDCTAAIEIAVKISNNSLAWSCKKNYSEMCSVYRKQSRVFKGVLRKY